MKKFKAAVYADVVNLYRNGGQRLDYEVLRDFAIRGGAEIVHLNAYQAVDTDRVNNDESYARGIEEFQAALRDFGYKVIAKNLRWYEDESGGRVSKVNTELDLSVDALLQSKGLDRVVVASGEEDMIPVIKALQNYGCRVEVIGLRNASLALRREADLFISGFVLPNLIPSRYQDTKDPSTAKPWGEIGSRVRGTCYWHSEQGYGFFRFLKANFTDLLVMDTRQSNSSYQTAYFHDSNLPSIVSPAELPSRRYIFEFELVSSDRGPGLQAMNIVSIKQ